MGNQNHLRAGKNYFKLKSNSTNLNKGNVLSSKGMDRSVRCFKRNTLVSALSGGMGTKKWAVFLQEQGSTANGIYLYLIYLKKVRDECNEKLKRRLWLIWVYRTWRQNLRKQIKYIKKYLGTRVNRILDLISYFIEACLSVICRDGLNIARDTVVRSKYNMMSKE